MESVRAAPLRCDACGACDAGHVCNGRNGWKPARSVGVRIVCGRSALDEEAPGETAQRLPVKLPNDRNRSSMHGVSMARRGHTSAPVPVIGVHWYGGLNTHNLDNSHNIAPEKFLLATEVSGSTGSVGGSGRAGGRRWRDSGGGRDRPRGAPHVTVV